MDFTIELADRIIRIECKYEKTYYMCLRYLVDDKIPDFELKITSKDILKEKKNFTKIPEDFKTIQYGYGDNYFEFLAVFRKIKECLISENILLMHGAVVALDDKGYMFTAPSGTGKTTHAKLWLKNIQGSYVVNGDKPLLKIDNDEVLAYGTPWSGKEGLNINDKVKLKAICILERGSVNEISEISYSKAFIKLYEQIYKPEKLNLLMRTFELLDLLKDKVKFYKLKCNMENEAAIMAYNYLVSTE